jgi:hypothetical protein
MGVSKRGALGVSQQTATLEQEPKRRSVWLNYWVCAKIPLNEAKFFEFSTTEVFGGWRLLAHVGSVFWARFALSSAPPPHSSMLDM